MLEALRLAAEGFAVVEVGIVVLLDERFQLDAETLAIVQHTIMVIRNAPWTGIDVVVTFEGDLLGCAPHLGVGVAAAQCPTAAPRFFPVFQDFDVVAS